jgi:hypothetical protein
MAEEGLVVETAEVPAVPSIEDIAKEQGWNPDHDGPDKIDAAEFVRRKPLFDKIKAQSRELKDIRRSVESMATTYKSMSEAQYRRGIADAEARMQAAEAAFDVAGFKAAQADKTAIQQAQAANTAPVAHPPEVDEFCERNPWFDSNKVMQVDALEYRDKYIKRNPNAPLKEVLEYVEQRIKRDYPEAFEPVGVKKSTAPVVEGDGGGSGKSDPLMKVRNSMSPEEKRVMKMFTSSGKMSEKEYLESYSAVREL